MAIDYCVIGEDPEDKKDSQWCLVARDKWSKALWATLVSCKGNGDTDAARKFLIFLESLGYTRIEVKSDGEPALVDVLKKVKALRTQETLLKHPPTYDPQSNGAAERAVQEFKGELRAIKLGLEQRLEAKHDPREPVLHWMIQHAGDMVNRYLVGEDGRTAFYRLHNKVFPSNVHTKMASLWISLLQRHLKRFFGERLLTIQ